MSPVSELPVKGSQFSNVARSAQPPSGAEPARHAVSRQACGLQQAGRRDHSLRNACPKRVVPGEALKFATTLPLSGYGRGVHRNLHRRASDQGRGQSAASGKPRRDRRVCRSGGIVAVRSGPLAHACCNNGAIAVLRCLPAGAAAAAQQMQQTGRRRFPAAHRARHLADAVAADRRFPADVSESRLARPRAGRRRG